MPLDSRAGICAASHEMLLAARTAVARLTNISGPGIKGTIVPGGWDWQLRRADGCLQSEANYMLRTDDGVVINIINKGVSCPGPDGKRQAVRTQPVFEPPLGKYDWLGKSAVVGTLDPAGQPGQPAVRIGIYKVN